MAQVTERRRTLHNPAGGRRQKRRRNRHMTAKQIRHFGTRRQKAALKRSRRQARPNTARAKPHAHKQSHRKRTRPRAAARKNAGEIVTFALPLLNPARKKRSTKVAKQARKAKSSGSRRRHNRKRRQSRRTNPMYQARSSHRKRSRRGNRSHRRRRNPAAALQQLPRFITGGMWLIGGALGTRMLTQAVLGAQNKDWLGYGGNLAAAFILGGAAQMLMRGRTGIEARNFIILGGTVATILRVVTDKTPWGARFAQLGLGDYQVQGFLTPQRLANGLRSAQLDYPAQIRPPAVVAANAGVAGLGRRSLVVGG